VIQAICHDQLSCNSEYFFGSKKIGSTLFKIKKYSVSINQMKRINLKAIEQISKSVN